MIWLAWDLELRCPACLRLIRRCGPRVRFSGQCTLSALSSNGPLACAEVCSIVPVVLGATPSRGQFKPLQMIYGLIPDNYSYEDVQRCW